jgi:hypothetical protein
MTSKTTIVIATLCAASSSAFAGYTITQQNAPAPTYSNTLNFDEPNGPTGPVNADAFAALGLASLTSGAGDQSVGDNSKFFPWVNDGNSMFANFGMTAVFANDITEFSIQIWDPSGEPTFFGGGLQVVLLNDGEVVWDLGTQNGQIATPAWGGVGDSWFNITTTDGMTFDEVIMFGNGFTPTAFIDNLSWNAIPTPGTVGLLSLAAFAGARRRRD